MTTFVIIIHVLLGLALIGLVLIQHGKGADAGAAFGSGASGTVHGARGPANTLQKVTGWMVVAFFGTSLLLAYVINTSQEPSSVVDSAPVSESGNAPEQGGRTPSDKPAGTPTDVPSSNSAAPSGQEDGSTQSPSDVPGQ
ncbi:preprotein translocase subunit SecG [Guyparkeria sp. SCN-R1]|uniref:preprotein translocase subunit SecG n=1 Tax=Guyparkeria sp. SCN-R1 TaxID=2341113 RepID=UPI000F647287|nr:preprotein translocase subunit SecG [Guyparkeria sp. SCN-R1]RRQ23894.1 preprotein translocase subunit SecG [Guyparkeria sp. SCN-R1]